jgi:hypothetical protein
MRIDLVTHLRKTGPRHASNLLADLAVSRATLSRAVAAAGGQVVVRGQARRARYATRRALRGSWASLPLYRVDQQGQLHEAATLDLCHPTGSALAFAEPFAWPLDMAKDSLMRDGWFEGLPYPLHDARRKVFWAASSRASTPGCCRWQTIRRRGLTTTHYMPCRCSAGIYPVT